MRNVAAVAVALALVFFVAIVSAQQADEKPAEDSELSHNILAVVRPGGKAVFAVRDRRKSAVEKAITVAKKAGNKFEEKDLEVHLYDTPEELYRVAAPAPSVVVVGQYVLASKRQCVQVRWDSECRGSDKNWYRDVYAYKYNCRSGGKDDCWSTFGTVGSTFEFDSEEACKSGTSISSTALSGGYCD